MSEKDYKKIIRENLTNTLDSEPLHNLGEHIRGKVRDIYFPEGRILGKNIVMLTSDRISVFDHVLDRAIPFKGIVLNRLNKWAFENTKDIIKNASLPSSHPSILTQKYCKNIMIECVVRGFLWGSIALDYENGKDNPYGIDLPSGMLRYQKLDKPIFTPTTKSDHDQAISFNEMEAMIGKKLAKKARDVSIKLFNRASELAKKQGLIFIDTKYEFGQDENGELLLIDEANTPDSSRYCSVKEYEKFEMIKKEMKSSSYKNVSELLSQKPELKIKELSKQFVRDIITEKGFTYGSTGKLPNLTDEDIIEVSYRYIKLYEALTGNKFEFPHKNLRDELIKELEGGKIYERTGCNHGGLR